MSFTNPILLFRAPAFCQYRVGHRIIYLLVNTGNEYRDPASVLSHLRAYLPVDSLNQFRYSSEPSIMGSAMISGTS